MSLTQDAKKLLGKKAHPLEKHYPETYGAQVALEEFLQKLNAASEDERQAIDFYANLYMMPGSRLDKKFSETINRILAQEREHKRQLEDLYSYGKQLYEKMGAELSKEDAVRWCVANIRSFRDFDDATQKVANRYSLTWSSAQAVVEEAMNKTGIEFPDLR